jgi:NTE family protein
MQVGLVLGGGGARGLAHIPVLEAFDDLGIKPCCIAGTSIGALIGGAYAAGLTGEEIRDHVIALLATRKELWKKIFSVKIGEFFSMIDINPSRPAVINGDALMDFVFPDITAKTFDQLEIPFAAVATDFFAGTFMVVTSGNLKQAIAASIALPGLILPQVIHNRLLIDGGITNPLPVDALACDAEVIVAVDVTGGPEPEGKEKLKSRDLVFGSSQLMQRQITKHMLEKHPVDIFLQPDTDRFRVLDFFKARAILEASEHIREETKLALDKLLSAAP